MNEVNDFHNKAMDLAEFALIQRLRGNVEEELNLSRQALELELAAIDNLREYIEPTFSVLHRSAGTLALRCNDYRQAEHIAYKALAKEPPPEIAEELRDLVTQANFHRHLGLRGIELGRDEVQMSLSGKEVGYGMVSSGDFVSRVDDASKLIGRIAERQRESPFSERGPRKTVREGFPVLLSMPRAASFVVTLRVGRPTGQLHLPTEIQVIVDEFMDLMEMVDGSDIRGLEERIPEPPYLRNFIGLAKKIAPDGERVQQVGFTVERGRVERRVSITKPAAEITLPPIVEAATEDEILGKPVEIRGTLRFADAIGDEDNRIKIVDKEGKSRSVRVPMGMMNDIVQPMWDSNVIVRGLQRGRSIVLQDIELDEQNDSAR